VKSKILSEHDILLDDTDVYNILLEQATDFDDVIVRSVSEAAQSFIGDLFSALRERGIDLKSGKTVFVSGGSLLLKSQILASGKVSAPVFIADISANARGYELLHRAAKLRTTQ
jgi:plasmid segregation protein ParM